jgi:nitrate reductase gamma subunit
MLSGSHMHLAARYGVASFDIPVADYRSYISSLINLKPALPAGITGSPHYVIIMLHIFFANLFIMIFPFSKMIHSVFIFFTQNIKRK